MAENVYRAQIEVPSDRIILALDGMGLNQAEDTIQNVEGVIGLAKYNSAALKKGWNDTIEMTSGFGINVMADPKLHDIPATVALGAQAITEAGAKLITVHASGGFKMLEAAVEGRNKGRKWDDFKPFLAAQKETLGGILAVTVLTSLDSSECRSIFGELPERKVVDFAYRAMDAGIDGIVCSAKELKAIRATRAFDGLVTVVPGITPRWAVKASDQSRVAEPKEAVEDGADFLVIGRAINNAKDYGMTKREAAERIAQELAEDA